MAKKTVNRRNIKKTKSALVSPFNAYWDKNNYLIFLAGIIVIIAGYIFMSMGKWDSFSSLYISPVLLAIGYLIIFPLAILYNKKAEKSQGEVKETASDNK